MQTPFIRWQGALAPLAVPEYRRLLGSNALWWQTMFMEMIAVGWLVLELTDSPWLVSIIGFCRSAPFLLFGFVSGPLTDRFGRRKIIVTAQTVNLLAYITITALLWFERLSLWHLGLAAFCLGTAWAMDWPARRALLPDLVGKARTVDAMLLESFAQGIARILGPFVAGSLVAAFGARGCYTVLMLLSATTLTILHTLHKQPIVRTTTRPLTSPWNLISEMFRYVGHHQPILGVLLITMVMNLFIFPYMTLLPVFARDVLGQGPVGLGLLGTASGIGAFIGLIVINRARRTVSNGWILLVGTFWMCLGILAFALSPVYTLSWGVLFFAGMGQACFGIMQSSIILLTSSDEMRSRAMGALVLAIGSDPLGKLQTGALAQGLGAPMAISIQAAMAALSIVLIGLFLPGLRGAGPEGIKRTVPAPASD